MTKKAEEKPEDVDAVIIRRGRPPKLVADKDTLDIIWKLAMIHCTQDEIASILGVARGSFNRWLKTNEKVRELMERGYENGRKCLRRAQFDVAIQGKNPTMQIWLGKQLLGQRDKNDVSVEAKIVDMSAVEMLRQEIEAMVSRQLEPPREMKTIN